MRTASASPSVRLPDGLSGPQTLPGRGGTERPRPRHSRVTPHRRSASMGSMQNGNTDRRHRNAHVEGGRQGDFVMVPDEPEQLAMVTRARRCELPSIGPRPVSARHHPEPVPPDRSGCPVHAVLDPQPSCTWRPLVTRPAPPSLRGRRPQGHYAGPSSLPWWCGSRRFDSISAMSAVRPSQSSPWVGSWRGSPTWAPI